MKEREGGWGRPCEEREKKKKEINKNEKSVMMQVLTFFVVLCCLLCGDLVVIITCHGDVCACFIFLFFQTRGALFPLIGPSFSLQNLIRFLLLLVYFVL